MTRTIKTLIDNGCAVRGVSVRYVEWFNVIRGQVEYIREDGTVCVKGQDMFGPRTVFASPENCEVLE